MLTYTLIIMACFKSACLEVQPAKKILGTSSKACAEIAEIQIERFKETLPLKVKNKFYYTTNCIASGEVGE